MQVGVDIALDKKSFVNFDVKKIFIKTDVLAAGVKIDTLKLDPVVVGIGYGMRF